MEYITSLRKMIGHQPILMVGVTVLICNELGQLLLLKRTDNLCWGPPGGAIEPGEKLEASLRREILEETGLNLAKIKLFDAFSGPEFDYTYPNGDEVYNVIIVYSSQMDDHINHTIVLNEEHSEWKWFDLSDLPSSISPPLVPVIEKYISNER